MCPLPSDLCLSLWSPCPEKNCGTLRFRRCSWSRRRRKSRQAALSRHCSLSISASPSPSPSDGCYDDVPRICTDVPRVHVDDFSQDAEWPAKYKIIRQHGCVVELQVYLVPACVEPSRQLTLSLVGATKDHRSWEVPCLGARPGENRAIQDQHLQLMEVRTVEVQSRRPRKPARPGLLTVHCHRSARRIQELSCRNS